MEPTAPSGGLAALPATADRLMLLPPLQHLCLMGAAAAAV